MYVCVCRGITDTRIRQEVADGASSMRDLNERLGVASQCGKCGRCAKGVLAEALQEQVPVAFEPMPLPASA